MPRPPAPERTGSRDLMARAAVTKRERRLVKACVSAIRAYEDDMERREIEAEHNGYRNQHEGRDFTTPEDVLTRAKVPWRRQVTLLSISIACAHEEGLHMAYSTSSTWRQGINAARGRVRRSA